MLQHRFHGYLINFIKNDLFAPAEETNYITFLYQVFANETINSNSIGHWHGASFFGSGMVSQLQAHKKSGAQHAIPFKIRSHYQEL